MQHQFRKHLLHNPASELDLLIQPVGPLQRLRSTLSLLQPRTEQARKMKNIHIILERGLLEDDARTCGVEDNVFSALALREERGGDFRDFFLWDLGEHRRCRDPLPPAAAGSTGGQRHPGVKMWLDEALLLGKRAAETTGHQPLRTRAQGRKRSKGGINAERIQQHL